jgi:hypothetical protein
MNFGEKYKNCNSFSFYGAAAIYIPAERKKKTEEKYTL